MDLSEPTWRAELLAAVKHAKTTYDFRQLDSLLQKHLTDSFDPLVQAIVRKQLDEALAILKAKYPGSLERQLRIESAMRGMIEGP